MKILFILTFILLVATACIVQCTKITDLKVGDFAPDFTLFDQHGNAYTLSDMKGKKVALYFYPKDNTPGCSRQACSIQKGYEDLMDHGITVWGLSSGSKKSKSSFAKKYNLSYPLLITTKKVLKLYGVCGGILRLGLPKRYTFLIDENGIIAAILKNISLNNHAQQIIDAFEDIQ